MVEVVRSTVIDAPLEALWAILRDFNGHDRWHPPIVSSRLEHGGLTDQVGSVRNFVLQGGERLRELLLELDDERYRYRYAIVESEVPLFDYVATVDCKPVTDGRRTFWRWRSRFRTPPGQERELAELVGSGVYEVGFEALRALLEAAPATDSVVAPDAAPVVASPVAQSRAAPRTTPRTPSRAPAASPVIASRAPLAGTAVRLARHGGPEVLELVPCEATMPAAREVRLRQQAIGLNFIDIYCRSGLFHLVEPGGVLGMEAAGTVVDVGAGVTHVAVGDAVGYAAPPPGACASVRTVPADIVLKLPDTLPPADAAALLLKGITASFLTHAVHAVSAGETVLVYAPAGGVGQLLCRWCRALGARVIGVTSTQAKATIARAAGCEHVILRGDGPMPEALIRRVRELTDGRGADVILDAVGADSWDASVGALAVHGHLVSFGQASGDIGARDIGSLASRSARLSRPNYGHFVTPREALEREAQRLFAALADGTLAVPAYATYPLHEVAEAHRALESGSTTGPVVLDATARGNA